MIENGVKWARAGLIGGVLASVAGNIANACLTETSVSVLLRIPMAIVWPTALFVAVEVLVRNRGVRGWLARIGQGALLTITVPTAITSFVNLHALMIKAGEPGIAQLTGPVAIDGLMLGCTIMMLAARVDTVAMDTRPPAVDVMAEDQVATVADEASDWLAGLATRVDSTTTPAVPVTVRPVSGSPALARSNEIKPESVRKDVAVLIKAWDTADILERPSLKDMCELLSSSEGVSTRTIRRWRDALRYWEVSN